MFNYENFYKLYNVQEQSRYEERKAELAALVQQISHNKERGFREKLFSYLKAQGEYVLALIKLEEKWTPEYFQSASLKELQSDQEFLYQDLTGDHYEKSYVNPAYMAQLFSKNKELAPILSAFAKIFKDAVSDAFCHRRYRLSAAIGLYIDLQKQLSYGTVRAEALLGLLQQFQYRQVESDTAIWFHKKYNVSDGYWTDVICQEDLTQPYYLYQMGVMVSRRALTLQKFFATLPQEKLDRLAQALTEGYKKSYVRYLKNLHKRKTAPIYYPLGMERLVRRIIQLLREDLGIQPFIAAIESGEACQQYEYDHRFDLALYLDEEYTNDYLGAVRQLAEQNTVLLRAYGGPLVIESFGAVPFVPVMKPENLRLDETQSCLLARMQQQQKQILTEVGILDESSYTMMALPTAEVGEAFEEIFDAIAEINCMDGSQLAKAQHAMIGAMDRGVAIRVRGRGENETELLIALNHLPSPRRQTNFFNCLADCNIPAGEVSTSPKLEGTEGVLHIQKAFLQGLCFHNLKLTFKDGYVIDYSCSNYEEEEANRQYIYENLLHPYERLPLGEFAIGSNTRAYTVAKQYNIMEVLPALIIEKMGPHFALGDTCFAYQEEKSVFNPIDRKEMIARDNELSLLRKEEGQNAYTQKHIVMSLPFDEIGRMSVIKETGAEQDIIREGRFVLIGTDILNAPMMAYENGWKGDPYDIPHI